MLLIQDYPLWGKFLFPRVSETPPHSFPASNRRGPNSWPSTRTPAISFGACLSAQATNSKQKEFTTRALSDKAARLPQGAVLCSSPALSTSGSAHSNRRAETCYGNQNSTPKVK